MAWGGKGMVHTDPDHGNDNVYNCRTQQNADGRATQQSTPRPLLHPESNTGCLVSGHT